MSRISSPKHGRIIQGDITTGGQALQATLSTDLTGATNNDLTFTSRQRGTIGNTTRVRYVVSGNNTALSVSVSGADITVNSATDGAAAATSTAAQVKAAIEASAAADLLVTVANKAGNDGTGVVAALAYTALAGGADYVIGQTSGSSFRTRGY